MWRRRGRHQAEEPAIDVPARLDAYVRFEAPSRPKDDAEQLPAQAEPVEDDHKGDRNGTNPSATC